MSAVTTGSEKLRLALASFLKVCSAALDGARGAPARLWWLLVLVLAAICTMALITLVARLVADAPLPKVVFPAAPQGTAQQRLTLYPSADSSNAGTLVEASVDADLLGVISMGDQSRANMRVKGKKETVFAVGDELVAGVVIDSISPAYVVVRERGALRKITLKSLLVGNNGAVIEASSAVVQNVASDARAHPVEMPVAVSAVLTETGQSGLRIDAVDAAIAELAAIRVGDIIVAVEEITLSSLMADSAMLETLSRQQSLAVTLVRDGEQITLNMDGDGIRTLIAQ